MLPKLETAVAFNLILKMALVFKTTTGQGRLSLSRPTDGATEP